MQWWNIRFGRFMINCYLEQTELPVMTIFSFHCFPNGFHRTVSVWLHGPEWDCHKVVHILQFHNSWNIPIINFFDLREKKKPGTRSPPIYSCLVSVWNDTACSAFVPSIVGSFLMTEWARFQHTIFTLPLCSFFFLHLHLLLFQIVYVSLYLAFTFICSR